MEGSSISSGSRSGTEEVALVPHISQQLVGLGFENVQAAQDHRWGENEEVEAEAEAEAEVEVEVEGERQILQLSFWEGELR